MVRTSTFGGVDHGNALRILRKTGCSIRMAPIILYTYGANGSLDAQIQWAGIDMHDAVAYVLLVDERSVGVGERDERSRLHSRRPSRFPIWQYLGVIFIHHISNLLTQIVLHT